MSFGILPIEPIESCGVSANKSTDQNGADVPSGDLISRADLISELEEWKKNPNNDDSSVDMVNHFIGIIKALPSAEHKHCWDCKHYEPKYNVCHAPEVVKQVTSKLKNPCDSLLTDDNDNSKEQKSKLDLISRADAIDAIQNAYCKPCKERGDDYNEVRCRVCEYDNAIIQIDAQPSADRPKGKWTRYKRCDPVGDEIYAAMEAPDGKFFCNQCGKSAIKSDFCPHCGADMRPEI